jgi:hypothetical protein
MTKKTIYFTHSEICSCCGRALTDPVSVSIGIGPECIKIVEIDKAAMADVLSKGGIYFQEYNEGDAGWEQIHKKLSDRRLIQLDQELEKSLNDKNKEDILIILDRVEKNTLSLDESASVSKSRFTSLEKRMIKLKLTTELRIDSLATSIYLHFDDENFGVNAAVDSLLKVETIENKYNEIVRRLLNVKSDNGKDSLVNSQFEVHKIKAWCDSLSNGDRRTYGSDFLKKVLKDEERNTKITRESLLLENHNRKEIVTRENKEKSDKAEL